MSGAPAEHPTCPVCLHALSAAGQRLPIDLGCGHVVCDQCVSSQPDAFLRCPECRVPSNNPHISFALVRMLATAAPDSSSQGGLMASVQAGARRQDASSASRGTPGLTALQSLQAGRGHQALHPAAPGVTLLETFLGTGSAPSSSSSSQWWPSGWVPALWGHSGASASQRQHPQRLDGPRHTNVAHPAGPASSRGVEQVAAALASELPHALHEVRSSFWSWAAPLVAFLYVVSPLDLIPDVLPLIGWLDDMLVLVAVAWFLLSQLAQRHSTPGGRAPSPASGGRPRRSNAR